MRQNRVAYIVLVLLVAMCLAGGCRRRIAKQEPAYAAEEQNEAITSATAIPEPAIPPLATERPTAKPAETEPPTAAPVMEGADAEQAERMSEQTNREAEETQEAEDEIAAQATDTPSIGAEAVAAAEMDAPDEVTETIIAEQKGESTPSEDGSAVGLIIDRNARLLRNGLGALYECQKGYIYFETAEDYITVSKASALHTLILDAGGYNIAEKLQEETPAVTTDWVLRKNPNVIVKCVDSLGGGISDDKDARAALSALTQREGWQNVSAIVSGTVLLLSNELFETDEGQLLAKLFIAEAMYPQLFAANEIETICQAMKDAGGRDFLDGIYAISTSEGL